MAAVAPFATGFALLIDATVVADSGDLRRGGWSPGPLVITYKDYAAGPDIATTAINRAGQFSPRAAHTLYGDGGAAWSTGPARYHRWLSDPLDLESRGAAGSRIVGLELIVAREFSSLQDRAAVLLVHVDATSRESMRIAVATLARQRGRGEGAVGRESFCAWLETDPALAGCVALSVRVPSTIGESSVTRRVFTVANDGPSVDSIVDTSESLRRAISLVTGLSDNARIITEQAMADIVSNAMQLSVSWRGIIMRDGAVFVLLNEEDSFNDVAPVYVSTIHLDNLALSRLRARLVEELSMVGASIALSGPISDRRVDPLDHDLAMFKAGYWWAAASSSGIARTIAAAYDAQHRDADQLAQLESNVADLARVAQRKTDMRIAASAELLAVVALPFGFIFAMWTAIVGDDKTLVWAPFVLSAVLSTAIWFGLQWYRGRDG